MSINATIPPGQYIDDSGNLQGLHPDLGNEIAKRLCLEPAYMNVEFAVQIPGLATKRWDMVNTGMYYIIDEHLRISSAFQKANTSRLDSMIWSDVLMAKSFQTLQPKLEM